MIPVSNLWVLVHGNVYFLSLSLTCTGAARKNAERKTNTYCKCKLKGRKQLLHFQMFYLLLVLFLLTEENGLTIGLTSWEATKVRRPTDTCCVVSCRFCFLTSSHGPSFNRYEGPASSETRRISDVTFRKWSSRVEWGQKTISRQKALRENKNLLYGCAPNGGHEF